MQLQRTQPVHLPNIERFNQPIILFVTVCTKNRKEILANQHMHEAMLQAWRSAPRWRVGRYVIMPDHVHLFCAPTYESEPLTQWIRFWKRLVSIAAHMHGGLWERSFWDTQLRRIEDYEQKSQYVAENPVRKGLVKNAQDWPFQGVTNDLL